MANDFRSARFWAQELIEKALFDGARAVDATMGNGHDAQWLCELVGESGRVFAFDVQPAAVARTRTRLTDAGLMSRAELFCMGHERMAEAVDGEVDAIVFNLGWLPGAAHIVTTRTETTMRAVQAALELVQPDGFVSICVYPGHEEGTRELHALLAWAAGLDVRAYNVLHHNFIAAKAGTPQLLLIQKNG